MKGVTLKKVAITGAVVLVVLAVLSRLDDNNKIRATVYNYETV